MAGALHNANRIEVLSRAELREWLSLNHDTNSGVRLVTWKKHTAHYLSYGQLIEELLCWGWIDSQSKGVDEDRTSVFISPRNPRSAWSGANKDKVNRARMSGQMTPAGEAAIALAKDNGMWEFLDDVERLEIPADLEAALNAELRLVWEGYPRNVKRSALEWVKTAKRAETRAKRIEDIRQSTSDGLRPSPFRS